MLHRRRPISHPAGGDQHVAARPRQSASVNARWRENPRRRGSSRAGCVRVVAGGATGASTGVGATVHYGPRGGAVGGRPVRGRSVFGGASAGAGRAAIGPVPDPVAARRFDIGDRPAAGGASPAPDRPATSDAAGAKAVPRRSDGPLPMGGGERGGGRGGRGGRGAGSGDGAPGPARAAGDRPGT